MALLGSWRKMSEITEVLNYCCCSISQHIFLMEHQYSGWEQQPGYAFSCMHGFWWKHLLFSVWHMLKYVKKKYSSWWIISNLSYLRFDKLWGCNTSRLSYLIFLLQNVGEPGAQKNHDLCIGYDFSGSSQCVQLWWWWWKNT